MNFGGALEALKAGKKVAREGWNGKGMYIYRQEGTTIGPEQGRNEHLRGMEADLIWIRPHIDMKAADGSVVIGWLASQTDMLGEDWVVVE